MVPFLFPPSYTKREKQTQEPILLPSEIGASPRAKTDTKGDSYSRAGVVSAACNQLPTGTPPPPFTCPAYGRKAPAGATEPPPTSPIYLYHSKAYQFLWLLRGPALWEMWWAGAWGGDWCTCNRETNTSCQLGDLGLCQHPPPPDLGTARSCRVPWNCDGFWEGHP